MNKHFEDTQYYLKRATETAAEGLREELAPLESRVRELVGQETEPEPNRVEAIRDELETLQARAEGEAREAIAEARRRLQDYREQLTA